jgi:hypothetical protein
MRGTTTRDSVVCAAEGGGATPSGRIDIHGYSYIHEKKRIHSWDDERGGYAATTTDLPNAI